jgi:tetratricopeptide (TPR) repeat protein
MPIPHLCAGLLLLPLFAPPASELPRVLQALERARGGLSDIEALWELPDVWGYATRAEQDRIIRGLQRIEDNPRAPLPLRRLAARRRADRLRAAGRLADAQAAWRSLGIGTDFWIIGPFANPGGLGLEPPQAPEDTPPSDAPLPGKSRPVAWRRLPTAPPDGRLPLEDLFADDEPLSAYVRTGFALETDTEAVLWVGCAEGCKAWIDREPVLSDPGPHPYQPDQVAVRLSLSRGDHDLMIKVIRGGGDFSLTVSLTDPSGRPLPGLKTIAELDRLARAWTEKRARPLRAQPFPTLAELARPTEKQARPDSLALAALAHDLAAGGYIRRREAERLLEQALEALPPRDERQVRYRLWLSRISGDPQRQRVLLEEARRLRPDDAEIGWRLGRLLRSLNDPARALATLEPARRSHRRFLPAELEWCELLADLHLDGRAQASLEALLERAPESAEVLQAGGLLLRRLGSLRAEEVWRKAAAVSGEDEAVLRALLELAQEKGRVADALALLDRLIALNPWRAAWRIERGDLRAANGHIEEALADYREAEQLLPDDPQPRLRRAEALLRRGDNAAAIDAFGEALALSPHDQNLERRLRWLRPGGQPYYRPFELDARALMAEPASRWPDAPAVRLADRTVVRLFESGMSLRYHQEVIRVQTPAGAERLRVFRIEYAPDRQQVRVIAARRLRADGSVDTSATLRDISLSEPWYNLYYDVHAREVTFPQVVPGDVIDVAWEINDIGSGALLERFFGDLHPMQFDEPVSSVSYLLLLPERTEIQSFASPGIRHEEEAAQAGGDRLRLHRFEGNNLPGVEAEPGSGGFTSHHAFVHVSTFRDWNEVGAWYHDWVSSALQAGPEVERLARAPAGAAADPIERVREIYQFVANGLRYVGLEFGVHGYVPYPVEQVLQRRFGDCKDKSALLSTLLNLSGIRAEMALLRMKRLGELPEQPASLAPFNHAVCYLPDLDLWLDGTAAFHDIRELPAQDQDTLALVVSPGGGRLVRTPLSTPDRNRTSIDFELRPDGGGDGGGAVRIGIQGVLAPDLRMRFFGEADVRGLAEKTLSELFPGIRVSAASVRNIGEPDRPLEIQAEFQSPHLARPSAEGLDAPLLGRETFYQRLYAVLNQRTTDLELGPPWTVEWSVRWEPPPGLRLQTPPGPQRLESPFGRVEIDLQPDGNGARARARFVLSVSRVAKSDYPAFRDFLARADRLLSRNLRFARGAVP